jgi:streptomycin 6-kinase
MMPDLPPDFIRTIQNAFQGKGAGWLKALPGLLEEASCRWNLTDIRPVPDLSYNFVAFAKSPSPLAPLPTGEGNLVLKIGVPQKELTSEIAALRLYNGRGACRLLDADSETGMLLLERLQPGHMLAKLEDDVRATEIAADVMRQLWRPAPKNMEDLIQLTDWFDGFKRLRQRYNGETGPLPKRLVEAAESLSRELLAENMDEVLLHGDFHHSNVLESARGWLAIDPKGVIGPRGYEVGPFLINPVPDFLNGSNPRVQTAKRIAILSDMLGMEQERIRAWGVCHAVLSAWWSLEDGEDWEYAIRCAEIFQQVDV